MDQEERAATAARIQALVTELRQSSVGERLRDPAFRQRHVVEALLHNPDPVMREIGAQVRDGHIRLSDIQRVAAYREAFANAAQEAAQRLDPKETAKQLEELAARTRKSEPDQWNRR
jgi:hypothetical protein